ncbi:MAG: deoxyguanosinetriphosphate triphosphohydrolase [Candidatus Eiseniibacteriota bacterium]
MSTSSPETGLAPYATLPGASRGRLYPEAESPIRSPFQRDRDRVLHATAFRRMKHKTQVFVAHEGDHYRTRLTHSLEVAQIARTICRTLRLNEDLVEALSLAHDLGHTPFGHAGEEALNTAMAPYGGFDHNAQTLRILTRLERRYAEFDGLNLTWETLEGVVKHNGPLTGPMSGGKPVAVPILEYVEIHDLELGTFPGIEAQVAALSDDIAYNNHDIDDGLRAELFEVGDLADIPLVGDMIRTVQSRYPELEETRLIHETVRRLIDYMVNDLLAETRRRLEAAKPADVAAVRALDHAVVAFSDTMRQADAALRAFLHERMYRHQKVNRMTNEARRIVTDLFTLMLANPDVLPYEWRRRADAPKSPRTARLVADYIAGMTDSFALDEHRRLFAPPTARI